MKAASISWFASFGVGVATAIVGLLVGGWLANRFVSWYHIPVRDGGAGYFIAFQALFAAFVGLILGIVVSRYAGNFMDVTVMRALVSAQVLMLLLLGTVGGVARLFADVPPEIGGQKLLLSVELSWPEAGAPVLESSTSEAYLRLRSSVGRGVDMPKDGALWTDRPRHESSRVIVPGAVEIYTGRGKRLLQVMNGDSTTTAFEVPLESAPKQSALEWSVWIPVAAGSAGSETAALQYRYRVVKRNEPVRVDTVGPFTVEMMVSSFNLYQFQNDPKRMSANATYRVFHNGNAVALLVRQPAANKTARVAGATSDTANMPFKEINAVAVVGGAVPSLVAHLDGRSGAGGYGLIREANGAPVVEYVSAAVFRVFTHRLDVNSSGTITSVTTSKPLDGRMDRNTLAVPALYAFPEAVLDTRSFAVHALPREAYDNDLKYMAPVSLSPDASKLARLGGDMGKPVLRELSLRSGAGMDVPLTNVPVANGVWTSADHAWFDHYFEWKANTAGEFSVVQRPNTVTIIRRGSLLQEPGYRQYDLSPVDSGMREVVKQFLVQEFKAVLQPAGADDYSHTLIVEGTPFMCHTLTAKLGCIWIATRTRSWWPPLPESLTKHSRPGVMMRTFRRVSQISGANTSHAASFVMSPMSICAVQRPSSCGRAPVATF